MGRVIKLAGPTVKQVKKFVDDYLWRLDAGRFERSGYMLSGASAYWTDSVTGLTLRVSDHASPAWGGYNQGTEDRYGEADIQIDSGGGKNSWSLGYWKLAVEAYLQMVKQSESEFEEEN